MNWTQLAEDLLKATLPTLLTFLATRGHDVVGTAQTAVDNAAKTN